MRKSMPILWFKEITLDHVNRVGGKNASLGELTHNLSPLGIKVPNGFAVTADAYREFLAENQLNQLIQPKLNLLNEDLNNLTMVGREIRALIMQASFSEELTSAIFDAYSALMLEKNTSVAVRSSATTEDLANASFAGQQETFLNIAGIENVLSAVKEVFASLFNDRAIAYRIHQGFSHDDIAISVGIQHMVRSDLATSGVMFSMDTESGFDKVVLINGAYGLGESVVQGLVNPDEFYVYKANLKRGQPALLRRRLGTKAHKLIYDPTATTVAESILQVPVVAKEQRQFCLTDEEAEFLARQAVLIEEHYRRPMDIEWAKDGVDQQIYIVQARPETVNSQQVGSCIERYQLQQAGKVLVTGFSVGQRISHGTAKVLKDISEIAQLQKGDVLVTDMTDPNWEPVMKKASAIVTNRGGRTCHAAIIARELGIPAVVGCSDATAKILTGEMVTVSCAEGETGFVYQGELPFSIQKIDTTTMPDISVDLMLNVGNPERAFALQKLPSGGVGLARIEFIINNMIGIHPKAALDYVQLMEPLRATIDEKIAGYQTPVQFYVHKLQEGIATIAAAFYPKPVIVRLSDFKSNEYANLLGGDLYEPREENPMLGFRGASRYVSAEFRDCFALECEAIRFVREKMGLTNVKLMVPFVRTLSEAQMVIKLLEELGLKRGVQELEIIMMCEIPSNALLAGQFLEHFDWFSIGSNDLTQLTLGLDRDSGLVADQFDERDEAVKSLLQKAIVACRQKNKYIGICGQGPSDHLDLARWLMDEKITSLSLNADSLLETWLALAK